MRGAAKMSQLQLLLLLLLASPALPQVLVQTTCEETSSLFLLLERKQAPPRAILFYNFREAQVGHSLSVGRKPHHGRKSQNLSHNDPHLRAHLPTAKTIRFRHIADREDVWRGQTFLIDGQEWRVEELGNIPLEPLVWVILRRHSGGGMRWALSLAELLERASSAHHSGTGSPPTVPAAAAAAAAGLPHRLEDLVDELGRVFEDPALEEFWSRGEWRDHVADSATMIHVSPNIL